MLVEVAQFIQIPKIPTEMWKRVVKDR